MASMSSDQGREMFKKVVPACLTNEEYPDEEFPEGAPLEEQSKFITFTTFREVHYQHLCVFTVQNNTILNMSCFVKFLIL